MTERIVEMETHSTNVRYNNIKSKAIHFLMSVSNYITPNLAKRFILKNFFTPAMYNPTPLETEYLEAGETFQIRVHGKQIQGWKWGCGPSILFVHGWNGRGIQFRYFFEAFLNAGYSIITYDAPAHGESEGDNTNYFELSDTVRSFLNPDHGLNIHGIIAYSLGGSAVVNCLAKEKLSLDVVLIAPALKLKEIFYNTFNYHGVPKILYQRVIADLEEQYGQDVHEDNPSKLLQNIDLDIIIIHDKDDKTVPFADSKALSDKLKNLHLLTTKGLGHKRILADNAVIDFTLRYFLSRSTHRSIGAIQAEPIFDNRYHAL